MAEMGMAALTAARVEPRGPYMERFGESAPDEMPEVARELIMMRGVISGIEMMARNVEENLNLLREKISPIMDRRDKPQPAQVTEIKAEGGGDKHMQPVSDVATDIAVLRQMLNVQVEALDRLGTQIWSITRDVSL